MKAAVFEDRIAPPMRKEATAPQSDARRRLELNLTNRLRTVLSVCLAALLALGSSIANAQELQWYTVEIIVFRMLDESGLYLERWPIDPGQPRVDLARSLNGAIFPDAPQNTAENGAFSLLGADQFELGEVASALKRSRGYQPVLHVAWRQPGFSQSEAITVRVHSQLANPYRTDETAVLRQASEYESFALEQAPAASLPSAVLDGTIRLRRGRYLHVDADLVYYRPPSVTRVAGAGLEPSLFRLTESRRMRSSELHFLDHPMFGMLVEVRPYERAETASTPPDPATQTSQPPSGAQPSE